MPISDIKPALERIHAGQVKYKEYYDYYDGVHQLNFASDKFKNKFGKRLQRLRQNLCKTAVHAPASRLELVGFQSDKKTDIEKRAWAIWKKNKMPRNSGKTHREAFKTGDAYVLVWGDRVTGKPRIFPQIAANCTVWKSSETGEIEKAAKAWKGNDGFYYLNLYYRDRVEKYVTRGKCASLPLDAGLFDQRHVQGETFPLLHTYGRVPVFHFTYDEELQDFGTSFLKDLIPLNDAVNKSWADILGAQEENMRRRRYVAGMQVETDEETGRKINPFKPDDDILFADDAETKFGEFSDADLAQMLQVLEAAIAAICLVSGIPPSYFNLEQTGNAISGEALRKLEARFIAIIQEAQRSFGETWAEVIALCIEIEDTSTETLEIEPQWTDAAPTSDEEFFATALMKLQAGWSIEQIQRDYGMSDEQIQVMMDENRKREEAKLEAEHKAFDAGESFQE